MLFIWLSTLYMALRQAER